MQGDGAGVNGAAGRLWRAWADPDAWCSAAAPPGGCPVRVARVDARALDAAAAREATEQGARDAVDAYMDAAVAWHLRSGAQAVMAVVTGGSAADARAAAAGGAFDARAAALQWAAARDWDMLPHQYVSWIGLEPRMGIDGRGSVLETCAAAWTNSVARRARAGGSALMPLLASPGAGDLALLRLEEENLEQCAGMDVDSVMLMFAERLTPRSPVMLDVDTDTPDAWVCVAQWAMSRACQGAGWPVWVRARSRTGETPGAGECFDLRAARASLDGPLSAPSRALWCFPTASVCAATLMGALMQEPALCALWSGAGGTGSRTRAGMAHELRADGGAWPACARDAAYGWVLWVRPGRRSVVCVDPSRACILVAAARCMAAGVDMAALVGPDDPSPPSPRAARALAYESARLPGGAGEWRAEVTRLRQCAARLQAALSLVADPGRAPAEPGPETRAIWARRIWPDPWAEDPAGGGV